MSRIIYLFLATLVGCTSARLDTEKRFQEKHRPQYHFTPPSKWMNDPNGMVYYEGEYHLFYQHHPYSTVWGPMHWGHAITKDLVHWEHLPIALYPDSLGYIFSGSCVIDWKNTSGFGKNGEPPMVAIFTHGVLDEQKIPQKQSVAYSLDKGRTWTKYEGNPVIDEGLRAFRDPKIFWHDTSESWIMSLAATTDNVGIRPDHIRFYTSDDLKSWKYLSDFGHTIGSQDGKWECPDLFKMKVEGQEKEKWVLLVSINPGGPQGGSATQYFVGDFDGSEFTPEDSVTRWLDYGADNYAGVTWSNVPANDGRRLFLGWMSSWQYAMVVPTQSWRSAMTVPRELILEGSILKSRPVVELEMLRREAFEMQPDQAEFLLEDNLLDLNVEVQDSLTQLIFSNISGDRLTVLVTRNELIIDRSKAGINNFSSVFPAVHRGESPSEIKNLRILMDHSSIEVFANAGELVMTELIFPNSLYTGLEKIGKARLTGYRLSGIWNSEIGQHRERTGFFSVFASGRSK